MRNSENFFNDEIGPLKQDFLRGLGAKSDDELIANLDKSFLGDAYQANVVNIFKRFYQEKIFDHQNPKIDFLQSLQKWNQENLAKEFDTRFNVAICNVAGLSGALLLNFFASPIAGIACAIGVVGVSSVAEAQAKRNIANLGHLSSHFANKLESATKKMQEDFKEKFGFELVFDEAKKKDNSGIYRMLSYFSGASLSATEKGFSRFSSFAEATNFIVNSVIGSIIPIVPLISYGLSKKSADLRQDRFSKIVENLHLTVDKICQKIEEKSDKSAESVEKLQEIFSNFATNLKASDSSGRAVASKVNKDKKTNASKLISLGPWVLSKIRKAIIGVFKNCFSQNKFDEDLSAQISIFPSQEIYLSHQEKIEDLKLVEVFKSEEVTSELLSATPLLTDDVAVKSSTELSVFTSQISLFSNDKRLAFLPIYPEGKSPTESDLESFNSTLNSYKKLNSPESHPTLAPQNHNSEILFNPINPINPIKSIMPIYAKGQTPWELDKPSTAVNRAESFSPHQLKFFSA